MPSSRNADLQSVRGGGEDSFILGNFCELGGRVGGEEKILAWETCLNGGILNSNSLPQSPQAYWAIVKFGVIRSSSRELRERERLAAGSPPLAGLAGAREPEALHALEVAVLSVAHQVFVECGDPLRPLGKSHSVTRHGVPGGKTTLLKRPLENALSLSLSLHSPRSHC